jgi:hypothetical protein
MTQAGDNDCLLFMGSKDRDGYGSFWLNGRSIKAHRASWIIAHGEITGGLWVLHACDTPACVNPDHLFLGTCADNWADCIAKGRTARGLKNGRHTRPDRTHRPTGEANPAAKLSASQAIEIRQDVRSYAKIAVAHGVSKSLVAAIKWGKIWRTRSWYAQQRTAFGAK